MTLTNKDKKLLVYLIAICIVAGSYFFAAKPLLDKQEALSKENQKLQTEVNYYSDYYINQDKYNESIVASKAKYDELIKKFFGEIEQDNTLVMIDGIEDATNVWISRISFQNSEVMINGTTTESVVSEEITEETTDSSEVTSENQEEPVSSVAISGMKQDLNIDYSGTYSDFKGFLDYLNNYDKRLFISSLSASYSADSDQISGMIIMSQYAIPGEVDYEEPDLSSVDMGVNNVFSSLKNVSQPGEIEIGQIIAEEEADSENIENPDESGRVQPEQDEQAEQDELVEEVPEIEPETENKTSTPKGGGGII